MSRTSIRSRSTALAVGGGLTLAAGVTALALAGGGALASTADSTPTEGPTPSESSDDDRSLGERFRDRFDGEGRGWAGGHGRGGPDGFGGPFGRPFGGPFGGGLMGNGLHGEAVVDRDGEFVTVVGQRGTVTEVDADSLTVESVDGFSLTWTVDGDTLYPVLGEDGRQEGTLDDIAVGDEVGVAGEESGDATTAAVVHERPADTTDDVDAEDDA